MFKNTSFWCIVLGIVVVMIIRHIMTDKPLIEGNENDKTTLKDINVNCEGWAKNGECIEKSQIYVKQMC